MDLAMVNVDTDQRIFFIMWFFVQLIINLYALDKISILINEIIDSNDAMHEILYRLQKMQKSEKESDEDGEIIIEEDDETAE